MFLVTPFIFYFFRDSSIYTIYTVTFTTTNKFHFALVFDITYPPTYALFQCKLRASEYKDTQLASFFDFGVQQMLEILLAKWTKAFGKGYVLSKTKINETC